MFKIIINGLQICDQNSGVQFYSQALFSELNTSESKSFEFYLLQYSGFKCKTPFLKPVVRILYENLFLKRYIKRHHYSLYHATNYVLPFSINYPSVLTIHDLITLDFPKLCQRESVVYFRLLLSRSIKKADKIIAVSNTVKKDIVRHFAVSEDKIKVVYHGVSPVLKKITDSEVLKKTRQKYQLPEKYILFVGNIEPKKNLDRLIQSFIKLKNSVQLNHKLVIAGKKGWRYRPIFKTIERLNIGSEIVFTGYISEEDLPAIYSMADLFVFPSLYEGFGIPPLEAMACETPVLVSKTGALPETTGGNCLMVDPYDIGSISEGMKLLLTDEELRKEYVKKGKEWVKQFTWEKTARKTVDVYKEVGCLKGGNL